MSTSLNRRQLLRGFAGVGGALAAVSTSASATEEHPAHPVAPADAIAMLFDNTICTGCRACMPACNEANSLPADSLMSGGIWDMPSDLNSKTKNIIKVYEEPGEPGYFPSWPEVMMTIGYISLGIVGFGLAVKFFAVLPGDDHDWNHIFRPIGRIRWHIKWPHWREQATQLEHVTEPKGEMPSLASR